ncbi:hypothetical protein [Nonomuraea endophytica]|uniref:hypothetical protein n=1 Tax=Nonomuraea endophytica TaxID=714136 RepID=UPI0037CCAA28
MTATRVALVTGATQGLGLALVEGLAHRMSAQNTVYLTGRSLDRVNQAVDALPAGGARVRGRSSTATPRSTTSAPPGCCAPSRRC